MADSGLSISTTQKSHTTVSRNNPAFEKDRLESVYGGKRCVITKRTDLVQWCHVVPFANNEATHQLKQPKDLGLIPPTTTINSSINIFPLDATLHGAFDHKQMIIYPVENHLLERIELEERHLLLREQCIANQQTDPGRLDYADSYGKFHQTNSFQAFRAVNLNQFPIATVTSGRSQTYSLPPQELGLQPLPPFELNISIELLLYARCRDLDLVQSPEIPRLSQLGQYLKDLWFIDPSKFRGRRDELQTRLLPRPLQELPHPPPIQTPPSESTGASQPIHQNFEVSHSTISGPSCLPCDQHPGGRRNSPYYNEERCKAWASSITPSQDKVDVVLADRFTPETHDTEEEDLWQCDDVDSAEEIGLQEAKGPGVNVPRHPALTSNEAALMLYGVHLGGPVWD